MATIAKTSKPSWADMMAAEETEAEFKKILSKRDQTWAQIASDKEKKEPVKETEEKKEPVKETEEKKEPVKIVIIEKEQIKEEVSVKYEDKIINCLKCKVDFLFDAKEQEYFTENKYEPRKLCMPCKVETKKTKKDFNGPVIDKSYDFFCKICKRKDTMYVCELIFFKQQGYDKRTKCKDCKKKKPTKK